MRLERIADCAPRFVIYIGVMRPQFQFDETSVLSESARDCNDFLVTNISVAGKALAETFQTTVSTQPIRENESVNSTT
jgi:hypothetical protein